MNHHELNPWGVLDSSYITCSLKSNNPEGINGGGYIEFSSTYIVKLNDADNNIQWGKTNKEQKEYNQKILNWIIKKRMRWSRRKTKLFGAWLGRY